ncbi:hypothetical protein QR680_011722 [Steinernema hermaphroditum]|uniref:Uncharacterized protein n=1 Tax=Steinernema hermaphroditum TaxID=289476 RepID=A0AA39HZI9_9BILA|nr:hypothetical protein QR680_011722 [Steinernema hermaphroditum]
MIGGASPMPTSASPADRAPPVRACSPQAVLVAIVGRLATSTTVVERLFGFVLLTASLAYGLMWAKLHSGSLTRRRRASFFEANILNTYQPRARTHGHLFQPDPPTPVPNEQRAEATQSKSEFNLMREKHYANEYQYMQKTAKEIDEMSKNGNYVLPKTADSQIKVEDPVMIEFKEKAEEEDDEDRNIGSYRQDL